MNRVIGAMDASMCAKDAFIEPKSASITRQDVSKRAWIGFNCGEDESLGEQDAFNSARIEGKRPQDTCFDAESRVQRPEDGLSSSEGVLEDTGRACIGAANGLFGVEDEFDAAADVLAICEGTSIDPPGSVIVAALVRRGSRIGTLLRHARRLLKAGHGRTNGTART